MSTDSNQTETFYRQ